MTKDKYLKDLQKKLKRLPSEEREEVYDYYEEFLNEVEDPEEVLKKLPPAGELVARLKREMVENQGLDLGTHTLQLQGKGSINNGQVAAAKKQMWFVLGYAILATAMNHLGQSYHPGGFVDYSTGGALSLSIFTPVVLMLFFGIVHTLFLTKEVFLPLEKGFQRYFILKYLLPQMVLVYGLYSLRLGYAFFPLLTWLVELPLFTLGQRFVAYTAYGYLQGFFAPFFYCFACLFLLVFVNTIYQSNQGKKVLMPLLLVLAAWPTYHVGTVLAEPYEKRQEGIVALVLNSTYMPSAELEAYKEENIEFIPFSMKIDQIFLGEPVQRYMSMEEPEHYYLEIYPIEEGMETPELLEEYAEKVREVAMEHGYPSENIAVVWMEEGQGWYHYEF